MKFKNPFKKRNVHGIEQPTNECSIVLYLKDGGLTISVDWTDDVKPATLGGLIGTIATGEIVGPILEEVVQTLRDEGKEGDLEVIHDSIKFRINEYREKILSEDDEDDEQPIVQPIDAIRKQLTMFQNPQG